MSLEPILLFAVLYLPSYLSQGGGVSGGLFNSPLFNLTYWVTAASRVAIVLYVVVLREWSVAAPDDAPRQELDLSARATLERYGIGPLRLRDLAYGAATLAVVGVCMAPITLGAGLLDRSGAGALSSTVHWHLAAPWLLPLVLVTSLAAGYSEELFFRSYLLTRLPQIGVGIGGAVAGSVLLFGLGHLYEGVPGFVGTAIIGLVLSYVFLRRRSLHPIAIAHGLYNFLALVLTLGRPAG